MQITVQMSDGRQYPFAIADGQPSLDFLETIKYWEVFDRPMLRIRAGQDTWAFQPAAIEKILFLTSEDLGWRPPENILLSKCISLQSYRNKITALAARPPLSDQSFGEGMVLDAALKVTLASGAEDYVECVIMLRSRREQLINLYDLFNKVAYAIPCEGGGFVLYNPRHITCIQIHPAPPEDPDTAWLADEYTGLGLE